MGRVYFGKRLALKRYHNRQNLNVYANVCYDSNIFLLTRVMTQSQIYYYRLIIFEQNSRN